jgi:hypothetical protein
LSSLVSWLDDQPIALVLLGLVAVSLGVAIALTHLAERVFEPEARSRTSTSVTTAVGVVAGLYAVLAAFVIVNEWQAFHDAQATISSESAGVADALANASVLSEPGRSQIQQALFDYDRSVVCDEIPYLGTHEEPSPGTERALRNVYATVAQYGSSDNSEFYGNEVDALSDITTARKARINSAMSPIPDLLLVAVLVASLALIGTVTALDTKHRRWHIAITTALCVIVALNFLLIITLDRPLRRRGDGGRRTSARGDPGGGLALRPEPVDTMMRVVGDRITEAPLGVKRRYRAVTVSFARW